MSLTIKVKSGQNANRLNITPAMGEFLWTTDTKKLFVGDSSTPGGNAIGGSGDTVKLDNYVKPTAGGTIVPGDSVNDALGKLEVDISNATAGGGDVNVQSDWSAASGDSFIVNKPITITTTQSTKISGIQDGAQKNVQADWDAITPSAGQIANQPVGVIVEADRNVAGGFVGLDALNKLDFSILPALPTGDVHAAVDDADMLSLTGIVPGDIVIVENTGELYFANPSIDLAGSNTASDYTQMLHPGAGVVSVNGQVGVVTVDGSKLPLTGYAIATVDAAIDPVDNINVALGKLEFNLKRHSTFYGLDDTEFTSLSDGELAMYDDTIKKWVNTHTLDGGTY